MSPREADCPFCGKSEHDECSACGGVNAIAGADKKRRARCEAERAGAGTPTPDSTTTAAPVESAPASVAVLRTGN